MRKLLCALSVMGALVFAVAVYAAAPGNFAGTWTLDKSKSQGLNPRMQNAESVSWMITQTDKEVTIEAKITNANPPAGAPAGGGGGGRGKVVRKATVSGDGKTLDLSSKSTFEGPNGEVTLTTSEKLQLSGDGKSLTVTRHSESPRGPQDSTLVFNK